MNKQPNRLANTKAVNFTFRMGFALSIIALGMQFPNGWAFDNWPVKIAVALVFANMPKFVMWTAYIRFNENGGLSGKNLSKPGMLLITMGNVGVFIAGHLVKNTPITELTMTLILVVSAVLFALGMYLFATKLQKPE